MATVNINGKIFQGNNISISGSSIIVDGVERRSDVSGIVEVRILEGKLENLHTDASVNCNGVVYNVNAGGSVNCDTVGGNVKAGGSVNCDDIRGSCVAGGSIMRG